MDITDSPPAPDSRLILVSGASGYIGGRLVTALRAAGFRVRAMARNPATLARREKHWKDVEIVPGDVFDQESLDKALEGVHSAYYLIHSMGEGANDFGARDLLAAQNFARACERQHVARIVYLGGLGRRDGKLSEHLQSRQDTGEALRCTSVPVTELRAAVIVGSGSASFEMIRDLVNKLPIMICPKWINSRCEPIGIRQVLTYLVGVLTESRTIGETLDIGGGEILTYKEMMEQTADVLGRKVRIITVPILTPRLSSYWLGLVTSVPAGLARPLVEGLKNDVVCEDHRIREWIEVPQMSFREIVELAVFRETTGTRETRWTDALNRVFSPLPDATQRSFVDERVFITTAPPEAVFEVVQRIGGKNGWYYGDWLWKLRGLMDRLMGGVGLRRGRTDPLELGVGSAVDFWRVEEFVPGSHIALRAEMYVPGIARLEFHVTPRQDGPGAFLVQRARFWPKGLLGDLYWYAVVPFHHFIFRGMGTNITKLAEKLAAEDKTTIRRLRHGEYSRRGGDGSARQRRLPVLKRKG